MSYYIASPFKPTPKLLVSGTPEYVLGSLNNNTGPTLGTVISDSGTGAVSTVKFQILSGNIPITDTLVTIVGTANAAGAYNVTNATVLSVTKVPDANGNDVGIYTITFVGAGNSASTADYGQVIIPQREIGEALTTTASSAPVVCPASPSENLGKSISVTVKLPASTTANPSNLTGVTVLLQGANLDLDSEYNTIATIGTGLAAGTTTDWQSGQGDTATGTLAAGSVLLPNFRFYRLNISAVTGSGPIVGKLMI